MARYGPVAFVTKKGRTVSLRNLRPEDAGAIPEFLHRIATESNYTLQVPGKAVGIEQAAEKVREAMQSPDQLRLGVFDGENLIAQLGFHRLRPEHPWVRHLGYFGMMVRAEYWGEGIGRKLLLVMESFAATLGVAKIEATVRTKNDRALQLYAKCGYKIEGTRLRGALIDERFENEYYLGKLLGLAAPDERDWRPPTLTTKRLVLRPLIRSDAAAIFDYAKNPNVSRHTLWEPHATVDASLSFIAEYAENSYRSQQPEPLGITFKGEPQKVIGTVGCFWAGKAQQCMELGYALSEDYWGRGIMVEAAQALVDHCFQTYQVFRLQARCKSENTQSVRVLQKLGMHFEGVLRKSVFYRRKFSDLHFYSVLKDEWLAHRLHK